MRIRVILLSLVLLGGCFQSSNASDCDTKLKKIDNEIEKTKISKKAVSKINKDIFNILFFCPSNDYYLSKRIQLYEKVYEKAIKSKNLKAIRIAKYSKISLASNYLMLAYLNSTKNKKKKEKIYLLKTLKNLIFYVKNFKPSLFTYKNMYTIVVVRLYGIDELLPYYENLLKYYEGSRKKQSLENYLNRIKKDPKLEYGRSLKAYLAR